MRTTAVILLFAASMAAAGEFRESFTELDSAKWSRISGGTWEIKNGELEGKSSGGDGLLFYEGGTFTDFTLECSLKVVSREGSLVFRAKDKENLYLLVFSPKEKKDSQGSLLLLRREKGKETYFAGVEVQSKPGDLIKIKISVRGRVIDVYAANKLCLSVEDATFSKGKVGLRVYGDFFNSAEAYFDDFGIKSEGK